MTTEISRRRFTVDEFQRMGLSGIFKEKDHVELIRGDIIQMNPIGSAHAADVTHIGRLMILRLSNRALVRIQNPVDLDQDSEPEPDIVLVRPRRDGYRSSHPSVSDILLVIEVADTSLEYDRTVKIPCYATAGIPEVWLLDVISRTIEVHRKPRPDGYVQTLKLRAGDRIDLEAFPDVTFALNELLGE